MFHQSRHLWHSLLSLLSPRLGDPNGVKRSAGNVINSLVFSDGCAGERPDLRACVDLLVDMNRINIMQKLRLLEEAPGLKRFSDSGSDVANNKLVDYGNVSYSILLHIGCQHSPR